MSENLEIKTELPEKKSNFIQNEEIFTQIDGFYSKSNKLVLTGASGVGKSTIASEYGHKFSTTSSKNISKWFDSDSMLKLELNFVQSLAQQLFKADSTLLKENLLEKIGQNLAKSESKFLFIFDSLNKSSLGSNELFKLILKHLPHNVNVLITTKENSLDFMVSKLNSITVIALNKAEAEFFLKNSLNKSRSSEDVNNLLSSLEDEPYSPLKLAEISCLANYFDSAKTTDLIQQIKELNKEETCLSLLLKDIFSNRPSLALLIKHISFLNPDSISLDLIQKLTGLRNPNVELDQLKELRLASNGIKTDSIRVSPATLTQMAEYTKRDKNEHKKVYLRCFETLIDAATQDDLIQHVITLLDDKFSENVDKETLIYKKKLLEDYEKIFDEASRPSFGNALHNLGLSCQLLEDYDSANRYFSKAIEVYTKEPEQKLNLAAVLNNMGQSYRAINELRKALDLHYEALELHMSSSLRSEAKVTETLSFIDWCVRHLGDKAIAAQFYRRQIEVLSRIYEPDHPSIAGSLNNLGLSYRSMGEYEKSLDSYARAREIYTKCYAGRAHEDLATVFYNIGVGHQCLADSQRAVDNLSVALGLYRQIFDAHSPEIIDTLFGLSQSYSELNSSAKTIEIYKILLSIYNKREPRRCEEINKVLSSLASVYYDMELYEKAIECYKSGIDELSLAKSENEPELAVFLSSIGNCWYYLEKYSDSADYFSRALRVLMKNAEKNWLEIGQTLSFIGNCHSSSEEYSKAVEYHLKALAVFDENRTEQADFEKAILLNSLGNSYYYLREYSQSVETYKRALELRESLSGDDDDAELGEILRNIGLCYFDMEDYVKSAEFYNKLLELCSKRSPNTDDPEVEEVLCCLGDCYDCLKEPEKAVEFYNRALEIKIRVYDSDHPSIAETQGKIGLNLRAIGHGEK